MPTSCGRTWEAPPRPPRSAAPEDGTPHVAVVGGGITGLATAWYLRAATSPAPPTVTVLEADDRLGGKIRTEELGGVPVEAGPDTFLGRVPWARELCRELGMEGELVAPATSKAWLWRSGRLRPLPAGTVLGVPVTVGSLAPGRALSPAGTARATLDLVLPRRPLPDDPSVADLVGARMGREVVDRLVDPLVGGIHAGRADRLSLRSTAPPLAEAAVRRRSLILALRSREREVDGGPLFLGVSGGLERLVGRLASALERTDVRLGTTAGALSGGGGNRWRLECEPGPAVEADAVVLAVPAAAAAGVLSEVAPAVADELRHIRYASVVVTTLAYRPAAVPSALDGSGFLVPRSEGRLITACTWSTSKWPQLGASGLVVLRASAGRDGDERALGMDDDALVSALHRELTTMVGVTEPPTTSRVDRWPASFPQYEPGHDDRVGRIEAALAADTPGVFVAGAAYRGLGIAACVQQGRAVAERALGGIMGSG
ncbi:MAG TPA: protoporphyrinogen oxidase [Acidimicrobiales bacterium]|nr:protoporphyrinogen oxidase [Acidimicrobiales bacterium]